jgi:hypothetical protein
MADRRHFIVRCSLAALDAAGYRHHPALVCLRLGDAVAFKALTQSSYQKKNGSAADLQTASAPKDKTDIGVTAEPPGGPQVAPPSVDQSSKNLFPHSVPTIAYSLPPASAQMVSGPTAVAARTTERTPAAASESNMVLLAGAAAGLLFAGGVFHFARRGRSEIESTDA